MAIRAVQRVELVDKGRGQPVGEELRRHERLRGLEEAVRHVQSEDASEPRRSVARCHQAQEDQDTHEAGKAIDALEVKVVELQKEHGEEPATKLRTSLLLEILPDQVQLAVAQGLSSKKFDYDTS